MAKNRKVAFHTKRQGGTFKHVRVLTPETALEKAIRKSRSQLRRNPRGTTPFTQLPRIVQVAYRNRAISRLLQLLYSIMTPIQVFLSLNLDNRLRAEVGVIKFKKYLAKFFRTLRAEYPDCWFVYKIEWTHKAGFHLHMLGALFPGSISEAKILHHEKMVKRLWDNACDQEGSDICTAKMSRAVEAHRGYMTRPDKLNDDIECMKRLNGAKMFGKINPVNIQYHEIINDILSEEQFADLIAALIEHDKDRVDTSYYVKQARHEFGAIRGLDRKVLKCACNAVKNGKGGTS